MLIRPALQTGKLTIIPQAMAREILVDNTGRASGVSYIDKVQLLLDEVPEADVDTVLADPFQPNTWYTAAGPRLFHLHACANDRGAPGADHIDWPALAGALAAIGYGGAVSIESFTGENEAIARAASIWRPLAACQ